LFSGKDFPLDQSIEGSGNTQQGQNAAAKSQWIIHHGRDRSKDIGKPLKQFSI
jgi:hypothetical protein